MSTIIDLTGTTWQFNETVDFTDNSITYYINYSITCADSQYNQSGGTSLAFTIYNFSPQELRSGSKAAPPEPSTLLYRISVNTENYGIFMGSVGGSGCIFEAGNSSTGLRKTSDTSATTIDKITITGGTDATNSTLITWLESNATLIEEGGRRYE